MNTTPNANRKHIGIYGNTNSGKSSLMNTILGQEISLVSNVEGTTTDPVKKAMELLPVGPVVIIDTPGFDDEGGLGELRVKKTKEVLSKVDIAILVTENGKELNGTEKELISFFEEKKLPFIIARNKADINETEKNLRDNEISVSALTGENIYELKELIARLTKSAEKNKPLVSDLIGAGDKIVLVIPIDKAAPKGRLILPQQMTIRDVLDSGAVAITCRDTELTETLACLKDKPRLVITDSQAFGKVSKLVPDDIPLTSFSILMARYKGELSALVNGAAVLPKLCDGDRVLISEGCTHHRQCNDIGTVKMPAWIESFSGAKPEFSFTSGGDFPEDLSKYKLVVHCGGCMLNEKEMKSRTERCVLQNVPIVNYGVAIAQMNGILRRSLELFPDVLKIIE